MTKKRQAYYLLAGIIAIILAINLLFFYVSPEEIVVGIGVRNSYLAVFLLAAIGGLSTLTGTVLFASLLTFAAGGSSPLWLGLSAGLGIFLSDSIFFYLASYGREAVPSGWDKALDKLEQRVRRLPEWAVLLGTYVYLGLTPLPNDLLMLALVLGGYSYRRVLPVLILGSFTVALAVAYLGSWWF